MNGKQKFDKMNRQIELTLRGENLKQIIQINDEVKKEILEIENACIHICRKLEQQYQPNFKKVNKHLVIELMRIKNGKGACDTEFLENNYESFIEIGIEYHGEYYPNEYIPIWKCKTEWFQKIGYLTRKTTTELERIMNLTVKEMLEDHEG